MGKIVRFLLSVLSGIFLIFRWPAAAGALSGIVTGQVVDKFIEDKYLRVIVGCLMSSLFFLLLYNVGEIAAVITVIACYSAIETWWQSYLGYNNHEMSKMRT